MQTAVDDLFSFLTVEQEERGALRLGQRSRLQVLAKTCINVHDNRGSPGPNPRDDSVEAVRVVESLHEYGITVGRVIQR